MKIKRPLCGLLVLMLVLSCLIPMTLAAGTPTLSISSGSVKAGETVTLTVSIKDNPGIAASTMYVYFDTDAFSVDLIEDIEATGTFGREGGVITNTIEKARESGRYYGLPGKEGVVVLWYNGSGINTTGNGNVFKLTLTANKEAPNGSHSIKVGYAPDETFTEDGVTISVKTGEGSVKVSGGSNERVPETDKVVVDVPEFTDVEGHWAEKYIEQSAELGLVQGYMGLYRPDDTMTRGEFVTILWRAMGEPKPAKKASFTDLTQDWYKDAVAWAEHNQVVNGMGGGLFDPNGQVTREQLVTILHRLAGTPMGGEILVTSIYDGQYSDSGKIGAWAKNALYWSVYEGIFCGEDSVAIGSYLAPKNSATRAQIAVMMINYLNRE